MTKLRSKAALAILVGVSLLAGCINDQTTPKKSASDSTEIGTRYSENGTEAASPILVKTQYPVYSKDCPYISIEIQNNGQGTLEFGEEWQIEKRTGDTYELMEFVDNFAWTMPLYLLTEGGSFIQHCTLEYFSSPLDDGEYRVVKKLNGISYTADFSIGDSPITARTPHGFLPLSELPESYTAEEAVSDGVVVCYPDRIENSEKITAFFQSVGNANKRDQLRIAEPKSDGTLLIRDVILKTEGRIDYYSNESDSPMYFSCFTTDGSNIFLSNNGTFEPEEDRKLFQTANVPEEAIAAVSSHSSAQFQLSVYTPDGAVAASTRGGTELFFHSPTWGTVWNLISENVDSRTNIVRFEWLDNEICRVTAKRSDGTGYYEDIYVDRESMKNIKVLTFGQTPGDQAE